MVDKILNELKNKLNEVADCSEGNYVSLGFTTKFATINNIIKADEISIFENSLDVQSGHLNINVNLASDVNITKHDYGVESEYYINNDDMELYISLLGTV